MSFKSKFPKIAAFFAGLTDGGNEVVANEDFSKVELSQKQFEAIEAELNDLGAKAEASAKEAADAKAEVAQLKEANTALTKEKEDLTAKVDSLTADVAAKEEKLAEYKNIAAGGGHTKPAADGKAEAVDVNETKLNYSAENVELG